MGEGPRDILASGLATMWPRRKDRELLLDLGERKAWTESQWSTAIERVAAWLDAELSLPSVAIGRPVPTDPWATLKEISEGLPAREGSGGVARWARAVAPAVGATPKRLADSVSGGHRADRRDHRWMRAIARIRAGGGTPGAWAFHTRTPGNVAEALARGAGAETLDAGDALLLFSLIALWQRRRPTAEARGNRGRTEERRTTPKPVAALRDALIARGQIRPLFEIAKRMGGDRGAALATLTIECALTEAHLAPHPTRRTASVDSGEAWLAAVDAALDSTELLDPLNVEVLRFRIGRMRAYAEGRSFDSPDETLAVRSPYVRASRLMDEVRGGPPATDRVVDAHESGVLMLLPLLRARGFTVIG